MNILLKFSSLNDSSATKILGRNADSYFQEYASNKLEARQKFTIPYYIVVQQLAIDYLLKIRRNIVNESYTWKNSFKKVTNKNCRTTFVQ